MTDMSQVLRAVNDDGTLGDIIPIEPSAGWMLMRHGKSGQVIGMRPWTDMTWEVRGREGRLASWTVAEQWGPLS